MSEAIQISVERKNGGLSLSTLYQGQLYKMFYLFYALEEAKQEFRQYVRNSTKKK